MAGSGHTTPGTLVLVVGPSGAGKDTLLTLARHRLAGDPRFVFPRRCVTRPAGGDEDHDTLDPAAFADAAADGRFLLHWQAHGLSYGVPASAAGDLARGCTVAVNASRAVVAEALPRFPRLAVAYITAPPEVLAQRLSARSREQASDAAARLARAGPKLPEAAPVTVIMNDGPPGRAAEALVGLLLETQETPDGRT
jgi:ribose 1,5-bisphosphokinase